MIISYNTINSSIKGLISFKNYWVCVFSSFSFLFFCKSGGFSYSMFEIILLKPLDIEKESKPFMFAYEFPYYWSLKIRLKLAIRRARNIQHISFGRFSSRGTTTSLTHSSQHLSVL